MPRYWQSPDIPSSKRPTDRQGYLLESNARIDLLITDVGLPGGMNSRQVEDRVHTSRPDLKILCITGYAANAVIGQGRLETDMFVQTKPFQVDMLAAQLRAIIEARR